MQEQDVRQLSPSYPLVRERGEKSESTYLGCCLEEGGGEQFS